MGKKNQILGGMFGCSDWKCEELKKKMALGKKFGENEASGLGFVRYACSFGRKRIGISNYMEIESSFSTSTKKHYGATSSLSSEKSLLEALPQDILIKILCGVSHDDLKQLFHVSKLIREMTLIAKQWHFEYSTPKPARTLGFRDCFDLEASVELVDAPYAPKQPRWSRARTSTKKLADISVALFASPDEDRWPKKEVAGELETET